MARTGITPSDTVRAYVSLRKQQREPTLVNLRLELGKGSYSTLQKHLRMLALRRKDRLLAQRKGRTKEQS